MPCFRTYVEKKIRDVESCLALPSEETDWELIMPYCRSVLADVQKKATITGVPGAVEACRLSGRINIQDVRCMLAECLEACPSEKGDGAISVPQAAKQLGVSKELVYAMCRDGRMPCTKIGRRIVITLEQLASYQSASLASAGPLRHLS